MILIDKIKQNINLGRTIVAVSAIVAVITGSAFLIMYSDSKVEDSTGAIIAATNNSIVITPDDMGSYGELMFAYIGENNYIYNLDDESKPLIEQPASLLLYASDDTVIYVASTETDSNHFGRESVIQELQIGEHENLLYTIATVSIDPCWSSNDEVVYFIKDNEPTHLYTFEPLTSTTEFAADFGENVIGLRISSDGLLVMTESGEEKLYVPLSKTLTPAYYNSQGSRVLVCEQYDLILTPSGELSYRWLGSNEATKIADNVVVAKGYQDNEILFIQNTEDGKKLNVYYVSEEITKELTKVADNIMPQLTVSANYAFMIDAFNVVYKYDLDTKEFFPFTIVDANVLNPMIAVFDYRLMIYDLAREMDQTFVSYSDATIVPDETVIDKINAYIEESLAKFDSEDNIYPLLGMGSIGADVQQLQQSLVNLGYLNIQPTGIYDVSTTVAIQQLQAELQLPQTGIADSIIQAKLADGTIAAKISFPTLALSSEGIWVRDVQARLRTLGYMIYPVSGKIDTETIESLKVFAANNGIEYDGGILKSDLLSILFSSDAPSYDGYKLLQYGDCHSSVVRLNQRLKDLGYLAGAVNPSYDAKTNEALELLQKVNNVQYTSCNEEMQIFIYGNDVIQCPDELRPNALNDTVPSNPNQVISDRQLKIIRKWLTKQFAVNHTDKQAVKRLQMQLVRLGYMEKEKVSMIYDQETFNAILTFQTNNEISSDGIASKSVLTEIFRSEIDRSAEDESDDEE